jgi:hypothetical protein
MITTKPLTYGDLDNPLDKGLLVTANCPTFPEGTQLVITGFGKDHSVERPGNFVTVRKRGGTDDYRIYEHQLPAFNLTPVFAPLLDVLVHPVTFESGQKASLCVDPIYDGVDRPNCGGISCGFDSPKARKLAERVAAAIVAGKAADNPGKVKVDNDNQTYVHARLQLRGRAINADLRALGF